MIQGTCSKSRPPVISFTFQWVSDIRLSGAKMAHLRGEGRNAASALQPHMMHSTGMTWDGPVCQKDRRHVKLPPTESLSVWELRNARSLISPEASISSLCQSPRFSSLLANGLDNLLMVSNTKLLVWKKRNLTKSNQIYQSNPIKSATNFVLGITMQLKRIIKRIAMIKGALTCPLCP